MRDPNKNVTFVFRCYEKESADLKLRLRYDGLQQGEFFRAILKMYVAQEPLMMTVVGEIKRNRNTMGKKKIRSAIKEIEKGRELLSDLGITETDKQDIFDMIEKDLKDYE